MKALFATIAAVLVNIVAADSIGVCRNQVFFTDPTVDFLFVIDRSGSMRSKIEGVASGFKKFRQLIADSSLTSTRFGVVRYGGKPRVFLPFVEDQDDFEDAVNRLNKRNSGGQEAAFEAIRGSLPPENGKRFHRSCLTKYKNVCSLNWRPGALKVIILATDENSDWPTLKAYRVEGQDKKSVFRRFEPAFEPAIKYKGRMYRYSKRLQLTEPWELELKTTAQALLDNNAFVNFIVNPQGLGERESLFNRRNRYWKDTYHRKVQNPPTSDTTVSIIQFCHPYLQVQDNEFNNFNPAATLNVLKSKGLETSVQGRLLEAGGFARCYDVNFFRKGREHDNIIESFYESLIKSATSIVETCEFPAVTATQTSLPTFASAPLATETSTGDGDSTVEGVFVGSEDGEGGEVGVEGEEGGEAGVIEVTVGEGDEGSDASGSVSELNADGTTTNGINETSNTVYIGGAGAFVVAFAAIGGLIVRRRSVRAKEAEDAMTQFDGTQNTNPLYDGQGNNENPLYVAKSDHDLDQGSGATKPDFLQTAAV